MPQDKCTRTNLVFNPKQPYGCSGMTLVEMIVSLSIISILVLAMGSVLLIATHALPEANMSENNLWTAQQAAEQMSSELQFAISFTNRSTNTITFTVADRDTDSSPEIIQYAWSGTPGDALTRQYNNDEPVAILTDVNDFTLTYVTEQVVSESASASNEESGEILLAEYNTPSTLTDYSITTKAWIGQTIEPVLPADATAWSVTRVRFVARASGNTKGIAAVELRPTIPNYLLPSSTILATSSMRENSLGTVYTWQEFSFVNVTNIDPDQALCLVLASQVRDTTIAEIQYESAGGAGRIFSNDGGSSWARNSTRAMIYQVYGTVTAASKVEETLSYLDRIDLKLDLSTDVMETSVQILNAPEVTTQ